MALLRMRRTFDCPSCYRSSSSRAAFWDYGFAGERTIEGSLPGVGMAAAGRGRQKERGKPSPWVARWLIASSWVIGASRSIRASRQ